MNKFFLINKPSGISSFDVIRKMRKKLSIKKMGHTGTLDPLASGCLLIATGNYTKLIPYFEKDTKSYRANIMLDGTSSSYDNETDIFYLSEEKKNYYKNNIKLEDIDVLLLEKFSGEIYQIPPKYSALKIGGKKACDLVRQGKKVDLKERKVYIYETKIIKYDYPLLILELKVSAGTYIRSIANDIGAYLGTGGYLTGLERTKIGNLDIKDSICLDNLSLQNELDLKKVFSRELFVNIDNFSEKDITKLNNGLSFLYNNCENSLGNLFVYDGKNITNVVFYDGKKISPKRKI
ncbi:tRNA pseudouridine(55) synthase TruB [Candidatus Gracilibacteria bacterium]|nr:MAG: tRNA pseudouridine(55) synthase TruB [Candidatus Gracilibacteria bacterium]